MPNILILTEVQEAMRARYRAMLKERFPQLTMVRSDEPMTIEKDMNIVVHPTYFHAGYLN